LACTGESDRGPERGEFKKSNLLKRERKEGFATEGLPLESRLQGITTQQGGAGATGKYDAQAQQKSERKGGKRGGEKEMQRGYATIYTQYAPDRGMIQILGSSRNRSRGKENRKKERRKAGNTVYLEEQEKKGGGETTYLKPVLKGGSTRTNGSINRRLGNMRHVRATTFWRAAKVHADARRKKTD